MDKGNSILFKESYYNFKLPLEKGKQFIYNTKTGAIVLVHDVEENFIEHLLQNSGMSHNTLFNNLVKQGFLIKESDNELNEIKTWHENYMNVKNLIQLIVLPAEACNFSCPYCFIYKQRNIVMEQWVYDALFTYIKKRISHVHGEIMLHLSWFGGEPLLVYDKIIAFMKRISDLVKAHGAVILASTLYTNGYLLTYEVFEQLYASGIRSFQVTLDGDKDVHDAVRYLSDGTPTFDVIYRQLKEISSRSEKEFTFYLRANFLKNTVGAMESWLHSLHRDFNDDSRFQIYFRPVYHFNTSRKKEKPLDVCTSRGGTGSQIDLAFKVMKTMKCDLNHKGVHIFQPLPRPIYSWCTGRNRNVHIIGADGTIFPCDTLVTQKNGGIGKLTIDGEINFNDNARFWNESIFEEKNPCSMECASCKLLPVCLGGCKLSNADSGTKPCFWKEEDIIYSMKRYAQYISADM